jgi:hypothetical protein
MIEDKQFYNDSMRISEQLLIQFDKDIIREKLIAVYQSLLDCRQSFIINKSRLIEQPL